MDIASDCFGFADGDSSLDQPKSKDHSIPGPTKGRTMSNLCTIVEGPTKSSIFPVPNTRPKELVRKRKLAENSPYLRQAPKWTLWKRDVCPECSQLDLQKGTEFYKDAANRGQFREGFPMGGVGHRYRQPPETDCQLCLMLSTLEL